MAMGCAEFLGYYWTCWKTVARYCCDPDAALVSAILTNSGDAALVKDYHFGKLSTFISVYGSYVSHLGISELETILKDNFHSCGLFTKGTLEASAKRSAER